MRRTVLYWGVQAPALFWSRQGIQTFQACRANPWPKKPEEEEEEDGEGEDDDGVCIARRNRHSCVCRNVAGKQEKGEISPGSKRRDGFTWRRMNPRSGSSFSPLCLCVLVASATTTVCRMDILLYPHPSVSHSSWLSRPLTIGNSSFWSLNRTKPNRESVA